MIRVCWVTDAPDTIARGYWDQAIVEDLVAGRLWPDPAFRTGTVAHLDAVPGRGGAVVVLPARHHADRIGWVNVQLASLDWCLLILTGDEEGVFPGETLTHPLLRMWRQTPPPGGGAFPARPFGDGPPPGATEALRAFQRQAEPGGVRPLDVFFAGQVTHQRRHDTLRHLEHLPRSRIVATPGFTLGLPQDDYWRALASAKVAACPSGPFTPDTFRLFEALEAGCVPIVDAWASNVKRRGYWETLWPHDPVPFPIVDHWSEAPAHVTRIVEAWPADANRTRAWWLRQKRQMARDLRTDLEWVGAELPARPPVTVIVPTSPIPAHPDTTILTQTIASIRAQSWFADADIVLCFDGVRDEQESRRADYEEYQRRVLRLCADEWRGVVPIRSDRFVHQANLTRAALDLVDTPLILFVEHDTPLVGEIPWPGLAGAILRGDLDVVRFYHETVMQPEHRHLMLDPAPVGTPPLIRTAQWSQRPHLASADFYRRIIADNFGVESRTMIEDVMHGVVDQHWREHGRDGWSQFRLALYAPDGNLQRSTHLDGRGDDPKFPMWYRYPTATVPYGAPQPS